LGGGTSRDTRLTMRAARVILVAFAVLAVASTGAVGEGPLASSTIDRVHIVVRSEGNELIARRRAAVLYGSLEQATREVADPKRAMAAAIRVMRKFPAEMVEYLFGVTREGVLIVGEQTRRFDFRERRYVFVRGEMARAYPALDPTEPWKWLVDISVSRETSVHFEVRAERNAWPLETVDISPIRLP